MLSLGRERRNFLRKYQRRNQSKHSFKEALLLKVSLKQGKSVWIKTQQVTAKSFLLKKIFNQHTYFGGKRRKLNTNFNQNLYFRRKLKGNKHSQGRQIPLCISLFVMGQTTKWGGKRLLNLTVQGEIMDLDGRNHYLMKTIPEVIYC